MKKLCGLLSLLALAAFVSICTAADAPPAEKAAPAAAAAAPENPAAAALKSEKDKVSYALGAVLGKNLKPLKDYNMDVDLGIVCQGLQDSASGRKLALKESEINSLLAQMKTDVDKRREQISEQNKVGGPKFLEENAKKEGVKKLDSGVEYKVIEEGKGNLPGPTDVVTLNYSGTFIDGKPFDSSANHEAPLTVALDNGHFIPGLLDTLKLMKVGAKWIIYIPSDLAYGEKGSPVIPPNSVLIFEVEVLSIKPKPADASGMPPMMK